MNKIPRHKASQLSDFGMHLRRIENSPRDHTPVPYAHQDDFYIFALVENGTGCGIIDFKEQHFSAGDVFLIQPGQVHRFISSENAKGWLFMTDSCFVGNAEKFIFDNFSLSASSFQIDEQRMNELTQIAYLLSSRVNRITDRLTKATARRMAETFIGIVAEAMNEINRQQTEHNHRHMKIFLSFRRLLPEHLATNRRPSYYASRLCISTVYLNEAVKGVIGMNTASYIKNEVVMQAKRLLVHSNLSVKEIAYRIGIDDYAYFSRMFTQATGISPILFRERNLE